MRVVTIVARAFGPFRDATLELRPGLNVIGGPNESGKSTWNAAIRAALTGVRRGKGRPGFDAQQFADLHRPWDAPDVWQVEARVVLDDGREIDVLQDLADKVASAATDVGLGRDVSDEIIFQGSPDPSRWLGLDRDAFARTLWIGQGEILAVSDPQTADGLQTYLQRAAASQSAMTVAQALERLDEFQRNAIGSQWAPTKPLLANRARLQEAEQELAQGRTQHARYLTLLARAQTAKAEYERAALRCRAMRAALSQRAAAELEAKLKRAEDLAARYPTKPAGARERDELADRVAAALQSWKNRPQLIMLTGASAEDLRRELDALPTTSNGDEEPAQSVVDAFDAMLGARGAVAALGAEPDPGPAPEIDGLSEADLRALADELMAPIPHVAASVQQLSMLVAAIAQGRRRRLLAAAGIAVSVVVAVASLVASNVPVGAASIVLGTVLVLAVIIQQRFLASKIAARVELEQAVAPQEEARRAAEVRRREATARIETAGLPADPLVLLQAADSARQYALTSRDRDAWRERAQQARARAQQSDQALRAALALRDAPCGDGQPADDGYRAYLAACQSRKEATLAAKRRDALTQALRAREEADQSYAAARLALEQAQTALEAATKEACPELSVHATNDERVTALEGWQGTRSARLSMDHSALEEWQLLQALLGEGDLGALRRQAEDASRGAQDALRDVPLDALPPSDSVSATELVELEVTEHRRSTEKEEADAELKTLAASMKDIAELEENVFSVSEERARLDSLARIVETTIALLRSAEERVQRDLAPVLAASVGRHLAVVTGGRYAEVAVDPATLAVKVKEARTGKWRSAALLSGGTREQIYLLLRIALAEHLADAHETAPLFMDEVTAQSDPHRARALLEALLALARDRQIVLFTHDRGVVDWAKASLISERDQVIELAVAEAALHLNAAPAGASADAIGSGPAMTEQRNDSQ